ncbi:MAG: efflux RND transporter periplasmic adaptor subunit [Prevotella sp.]|nr:efflux RND transporter periplasmic adaptor subunit [Prevotella sp.]
MNKNMRFSLICVFTLILFSACQQKKNVQPDSEKTDTQMVTSEESSLPRQNVTSTTLTKGKIESVREIPVYSRIAEQIVMFGVENTGQMVKKGQVLVRLNDVALRDKILHSRAKLQKAEFQYQAILMGQGYKHDRLDAAPENIKKLARINSGYNEAETELHELEHQLSYCTITAPVSGAVSQIKNTLYGAAQPGEALFYIVDMEHLKVCFNVLENELAKYEEGAILTVTTVTFPSERHKATVSAFSPVIDSNGMAHVEATLEPHPHLMPGMTAFVTIATL